MLRRARALIAILAVACSSTEKRAPDTLRTPDSVAAAPAPLPPIVAPDPKTTASVEEQRALLKKSARTAWSFVARNYRPATGLVKAHDTYQFVTVWDIGSALASYHSAHALGVIDDAEYRAKTSKLLGTLEKLAFFDNGAFNKMYDAETGRMIDRKEKPSATGYGWSAIDIGRLLVWLRIVAEHDTSFSAPAKRIVDRLERGRVVRGGYLHGEDVGAQSGKHRSYMEGRIGYEQYAAEGFSLWGMKADSALDFLSNAEPVFFGGRRVFADRRKDDLLTSEPFILAGIELGWPSALWRELGTNVYAAQQARFASTGAMSMLSEDAIPQPPAYFYYYLLYRNGERFVTISPLGESRSSFPRWVSAKAAFGWHALFRTDYSWRAVQRVLPAGASGRGWTAGVLEKEGTAIHGANLNTSAVVLESALYFERGCALIRVGCVADTGK